MDHPQRVPLQLPQIQHRRKPLFIVSPLECLQPRQDKPWSILSWSRADLGDRHLDNGPRGLTN